MNEHHTEPPAPRDGPVSSGVFWGMVIIAFGVYFLLRETLHLDLPDLGRLWPIFLIAFGAWIVYEQYARRR